jgi:microtubule-associated protein-like 4
MNPISSLDWSVDGKHLKACSQDGELKFYAVETGDCLQDGKALLKDEQWASWTSHKGWPVQGLAQMPSEDPFLTCVVRANQKPLVAVGNCWGIVELYTYPNGSDATAHSSKAHSLEVANAIWMNQDTTLVTTGGHDLALMQWKVVALDL